MIIELKSFVAFFVIGIMDLVAHTHIFCLSIYNWSSIMLLLSFHALLLAAGRIFGVFGVLALLSYLLSVLHPNLSNINSCFSQWLLY